MTITDVYKSFFTGRCTANGIIRRGAAVIVTSVYDEGRISYELLVNFFPHENDRDMRMTSDCAAAKTIFAGKGRRSKKREKMIFETLREEADSLAAGLEGQIFWDSPITVPDTQEEAR
ncbi:MAG: hypothetical protein IJ251_03155 [Oscillospiraceae bacterium]|nr:hypothetical protein [Oscillospiraceae bacterium]